MSNRKKRTLKVVSKKNISENMLRIILGGDELNDFPQDHESGYVKLLFSPEDHSPLSVPPNNNIKPVTRSYTIRAFDSNKLELTLDFALHGDHNSGPASLWASKANIGEEILVDGPGAVKLADSSADWFFIAGDMTALPAIAVNLEKLPQHARGYAVIEILSENDKQIIDAPENIEFYWVINSAPETPNTKLIDKVKSLPWLEGTPNIWVASEFDSMKCLRYYFKQEQKVERNQIYASSYWKMGETDEGNKAAKKLDVDA